jgi:hypothetical protein
MWREVVSDLRFKFTSTGPGARLSSAARASASGRVGGGLLSLTTASSFLLELLDDIGDDNWLVADAIRDWTEAVCVTLRWIVLHCLCVVYNCVPLVFRWPKAWRWRVMWTSGMSCFCSI